MGCGRYWDFKNCQNPTRCVMKKTIFIIFMILFWTFVPRSYASWMFYNKPEYKGKVIDAETKEPVEGVVVSVYYKTNTYNIAGGGTRVIHTKETLTDVNGEFVIPSYTTIFSPFTTSDAAGFIIYKPGYGGYPSVIDLCKNPELYFSVEMLGIQGECMSGGISYKFVYGLIELPKLITRDQRLRAMPSHPSECDSKDFPLLYRLINEENQRLGLGVER
jgi:hypothetical protein